MTTIRQLERKVEKLETDVRKIKDIVGLLPPLARPLEWKELNPLDKKVLTVLIAADNGVSFRTTDLAEKLRLDKPAKTGRIYVWKSLRRIQRVGKKKRQKILLFDPAAKKWSLNRFDFMFKRGELFEKDKVP